MGYSHEWLIYAPQVTTSNLTTFNTTAAEYYAVPAITSNITQTYNIEEERELSNQRGRSGHELAGIAPTGNWTQKFYTENLLALWLTFMTDYVKQTDTPTAGNYTYGLLYDDSADLDFVSMQQIYKDTAQYPTDAMGLSILAGIVNSYTIEAAIGQSVRFNPTWLAKDVGVSTDDSAGDSKVWTYDGTTNTPNIIDVTSVIGIPSARPLWFYDSTLTYDSDAGAALTFNPTTQVSSFATMDTLSRVENLTIDVNHGLDEDGWELSSDRSRNAFCPGNRDINLNLTLSWCDRSTTLWELARAGTPIAMEFDFVRTASTRLVKFFFPAVFIEPFDLPDIAGDKTKRTFDVTGRAEMYAVNNTTTGTTTYDMNVVWVNGENL